MKNSIQEMLFLPLDFSTHGHRIDALILWMHVVMLVLFVGWGLFFLYTLVRFRSGRQPRADYHGVKSHMSSYLEVAVAIVEGVLLFGLAVPLWADRVDKIPPTETSEYVRVIGQQFQWNVHYPGPDGKFGRTDPALVDAAMVNFIGIDWDDPAAADDLVTNGELGLPVNRPVVIEIASLDVIHSFFLPELRVKQDAIPGLNIPVWFEATKTSAQYKREKYEAAQAAGDTSLSGPEDVRDLEVGCAQLCGLGHYRMVGKLYLLADDEYQAFYAAKRTELGF